MHCKQTTYKEKIRPSETQYQHQKKFIQRKKLISTNTQLNSSVRTMAVKFFES